jgi:hypothetical protein
MALALASVPIIKDSWWLAVEADRAEQSDWLAAMTLRERWPSFVHYIHGMVFYTDPDHLSLWEPKGESDCVWIVPGTL